MTSHFSVTAVAVILSATVTHAGASKPDYAEPGEVARRGGCTLCHQSAPRADSGATRRERAPTWDTIAARYRDDPRAEDRLTKIVLSGTGPLPADRHWRGKILLSEMPPNDVQVSPAQARTLVRWILDHPR